MGVKAARPAMMAPAAAIFLLLLAVAPLVGQGGVLRLHMDAVLPQGIGPVPVSLDYRVLPDPGTREMGLTLLLSGEVRVDSLRASLQTREVPVAMEEVRPGYWLGRVALGGLGKEGVEGPEPGRALGEREVGAPEKAVDTVRVSITYLVSNAWEGGGRVVLPVVASQWVPVDPHPRSFVGSVRIPSGLSVTESFPTSVVARPEGAEGGSYQMALQGIPSMLLLRTVQGEGPLFTLEGILDLVVVGLLLLMGVAGVRFLRREEA